MLDAKLSTLDIIIIFTYLIGIVIYGLSFAKKSADAKDYFLAGSSITWPVIGLSLIGANITSITLIGLPGDAYSFGISVFNYEWVAAIILVFVSIFFIPFYLKSQIYTIPEFLERRFDLRSRLFFSGITVISNVAVDIAGTLYGGYIVAKLVFPTADPLIVIISLAVAAAIYTIPGGLTSVIYTELIQTILLLVAATIVAIATFMKLGSWENVLQVTPANMLSLIRPIDDPHVPWTGLVFGVTLLGFYFWGTNQFMVQRTLSAKNLNHARWGSLLAGFIKLPVLFIMVLPGTMARFLYPDLESGDMVFPTLVFDILPTGLIGLVIAGLLAAMASSMSAALNSASTLVTMDFVQRLNPKVTNEKLVWWGKVITLILMIASVLIAPQIMKFDSLFRYIQTVLAYVVPPIACVFLWGLFWKRATANAAFISLVLGILAAVFLLAFDKVEFIHNIHFLHKGPILFVLSSVILVLISLFDKKPDEKQISAYIWTPRHYHEETKELKMLPWYLNYRIQSVLLLIVTAILIYIFR
jgi:SSS family solute:Na+ symporter